MFNLYVIGCGGIGGYVLDLLPQVMACLWVDNMNEGNRAVLLQTEGLSDDVHQSLFGKLVLIDGDSFSGHNALRQTATRGSKLAVQMQKIREKDAWTTWLNDVKLEGFDTYIKPSNMPSIFDFKFTQHWNYHRQIPIVFLCVDNHKTRYEVSKYLEEHMEHGLLINGGNERTTGNVTIYQKYWGTPQDPPLYKIYPEVNSNADKRPDEVACGTVAVNNDQTALINQMIASVMLNMFRKYIVAEGDDSAFSQRLRQKGASGEALYTRKNEVIIDLETNTMMTLAHKVDLDNRRKQTQVAEGAPEDAKLI